MLGIVFPAIPSIRPPIILSTLPLKDASTLVGPTSDNISFVVISNFLKSVVRLPNFSVPLDHALSPGPKKFAAASKEVPNILLLAVFAKFPKVSVTPLVMLLNTVPTLLTAFPTKVIALPAALTILEPTPAYADIACPAPIHIVPI